MSVKTTTKDDSPDILRVLYREIGYYINRLEKYEKALQFFDKSLAMNPADKRALLGRAKARAKIGRYQGALEDTKQAFGLDADDIVAVSHKALYSYLGCEFEDALVQNVRANERRKKPDNFTVGVMHCKDAIENCIGERAGRPLRDHYKIIRRLAWKKNIDKGKPYVPKSKHKKRKKAIADADKNKEAVVSNLRKKIAKPRMQSEQSETSMEESKYSCDALYENSSLRESVNSHKSELNVIPPGEPFPYKPFQNYSKKLEDYMALKYLDRMHIEKMFLKQLPGMPGVSTPNKENTKKIIELSKAGYKTANNSQELLRTRRPFYLIKYQEAKSSGALLQRQDIALKKAQESAKKDADALEEKINQALKDKKVKELHELADRMKTFCNFKCKKVLPDRDAYLHRMYDAICDGVFKSMLLKEGDYEWNNERRANYLLSMPGCKEPSNDSLAVQFKGQVNDWKKLCASYEERVRGAKTSAELAWLYYELGRFKCEQKQYEMARLYMRKCMSEAASSENHKWAINGHVYIAKINILQRNKNDAKNEIRSAMGVANEKIDEPGLNQFLKTCLHVIEKSPLDNRGSKALEDREKKIIEMMTDQNKDEVAHMFRKMSAMPANRRMSVMPGVTAESSHSKHSKTSAYSTSASQSEETLPAVLSKPQKAKHSRRSSLPGGKPNKEASFLNLIQFHIGS